VTTRQPGVDIKCNYCSLNVVISVIEGSLKNS